MIVAVIGSRSFNNFEVLEQTLNNIHQIQSIDLIVSGGARGADTLAEQYASKYGIETLIIYPDYEQYPSYAAPMIRNSDIIQESDHVVAFWDYKSPGTKDAISKARKLHKKVTIIDITNNNMLW